MIKRKKNLKIYFITNNKNRENWNLNHKEEKYVDKLI